MGKGTLKYLCIFSSHASGPYIPILCSKRADFCRAALYMLYRAKFGTSIPLFRSNMSNFLKKLQNFGAFRKLVINFHLSLHSTAIMPSNNCINGHVTHDDMQFLGSFGGPSNICMLSFQNKLVEFWSKLFYSLYIFVKNIA